MVRGCVAGTRSGCADSQGDAAGGLEGPVPSLPPDAADAGSAAAVRRGDARDPAHLLLADDDRRQREDLAIGVEPDDEAGRMPQVPDLRDRLLAQEAPLRRVDEGAPAHL